MCDVAGVINVNRNVTSISDDGVGIVTVTIATDFSSVNYLILRALLLMLPVLSIWTR